MSRFKPQVQVVTRESLREHRDSYHKKPMQEVHSFNTYTELKKKIKDFCERCIEEEGVFVVRSRRGQWGEWFERWQLVNGKPTIIKEGWM